MGKPATRDPKFFVVADGIDDQRVLFPVPDGTPVIAGDCFVRLTQRAAVGIDHSPVAIPASEKNENAPEFLLFNDLKSIGSLELARATRREAAINGIVFEKHALTMLVNGFRPGLKR